MVRVPETNRSLRHQLRSRLAWAGFGSLGGGVWLTPHVNREDEFMESLKAEPLAGAVSFVGAFGAVSNPRQVISTAWDLEEVRGRYHTFITRFSRLRPARPAAWFREQTLLVHAWRKFPFLDPDLPEDLLPANWPRARAHALFVDRHERWTAAAQDFFDELEASIEPPMAGLPGHSHLAANPGRRMATNPSA